LSQCNSRRSESRAIIVCMIRRCEAKVAVMNVDAVPPSCQRQHHPLKNINVPRNLERYRLLIRTPLPHTGYETSRSSPVRREAPTRVCSQRLTAASNETLESHPSQNRQLTTTGPLTPHRHYTAPKGLCPRRTDVAFRCRAWPPSLALASWSLSPLLALPCLLTINTEGERGP
jgi:hypothetical protein